MVYTKQYLNQQEAKQVQDRISSFMKNFRLNKRESPFISFAFIFLSSMNYLFNNAVTHHSCHAHPFFHKPVPQQGF